MELGKSYPFYQFTVQGNGSDSKGRTVKNPRLFQFMTKGGVSQTGYSIRVKKVEGFGQTSYLEISCYNGALKDAKRLKLDKGDVIDFYGIYDEVQGKKQIFRKVSINDHLQIRRFSKRAAKASEL
jgi:hypothetical protein